MISVIIPVLNEERALPGTLKALFQQQADFEVIVVDGGSTDNSLDIVKGYTGIRVLHATQGRARQMNAGAAVAQGDWLLFLHADTLLPDNALPFLNKQLNNPAIQAGGFRHRFSGNHIGLRLTSWLHNFRCGITKVFYGDQAMFIRRQLFKQLKGFPNEPILEDLLFGEKLTKVCTPVLLDDYVITDSRKFEQAGVWLSLYRVFVILICHELGLPIGARKFFANVR